MKTVENFLKSPAAPFVMIVTAFAGIMLMFVLSGPEAHSGSIAETRRLNTIPSAATNVVCVDEAKQWYTFDLEIAGRKRTFVRYGNGSFGELSP